MHTERKIVFFKNMNKDKIIIIPKLNNKSNEMSNFLTIIYLYIA